MAGCAAAPAAPSTSNADATAPVDGDAQFVGTIVSVDTKPWMYDGNAVVLVDTRERGHVAVQLPARWNLCKAAPVDTQALRVGMHVRVVGRASADGQLVVCQGASHMLVPAQ